MTAFMTSDVRTPRSAPVRPPLWPALAAAGLLLVSLGALVVEVADPTLAPLLAPAVGYGAGSIGVAVLVVVHRMRMQRAQQNNLFEPRRYLPSLVRVVLVAGLLAGAANAFFLATELAKR